LSAELDQLLEWLLTDVIADDVTSAEAALRELDEKCEKLGKRLDLIMKWKCPVCSVTVFQAYIHYSSFWSLSGLWHS